MPILHIRVLAILEMHNKPLELNGAALNAESDRPKRPARIDTNAVAIAYAIYTRLPEPLPSALALIVPPGIAARLKPNRNNNEPSKQVDFTDVIFFLFSPMR